jgi:hypothetical protein
MGFTVADVYQAIAELKQCGVVFEEYGSSELKTIMASRSWTATVRRGSRTARATSSSS